jgi:hypothetical protein
MSRKPGRPAKTEEVRSRKKTDKTRRRDRSIVGDHRRMLSLPAHVHKWAEENNKSLRFGNDDKNRLTQLFENDWDFVKFMGGAVGEVVTAETQGDCYRVLVGTKEGGDPLYAYLMAKDNDLFKEDYEEKQEEVNQIDEATKKGVAKPGDNQYVPTATPTNYKPYRRSTWRPVGD